jgi:hypothetical protein
MFSGKTAEDRDTIPAFSVAGGEYGCLNQLFPPIWLLPWAR